MLSNNLIEQMIGYAQHYAPREMCGLLFHDIGFVAAKNIADDPTLGFKIDRQEYLMTCMCVDDKPWALVHSHPNGSAGPSVKDCQLMDALQQEKQDLAMVIVGLQPVEIRCFTKRGDLYELQWANLKFLELNELSAL